MDKILLIDGAESGKRVNEIRDIIRKSIGPDELIIKYSTSNLDQDGNYHSLNGFKLAFIHAGENLDKYGLPIFNKQSKETGTKIVLYSGGFLGFTPNSEYFCEINDNILKTKISGFLKSLLKNHFLDTNFKLLVPGEKFLILEDLFTLRMQIILSIESFQNNNVNTEFEFQNILTNLFTLKNILNFYLNGNSIDFISRYEKNNELFIKESPKLINKINKCIFDYESKT